MMAGVGKEMLFCGMNSSLCQDSGLTQLSSFSHVIVLRRLHAELARDVLKMCGERKLSQLCSWDEKKTAIDSGNVQNLVDADDEESDFWPTRQIFKLLEDKRYGFYEVF